jgi:prefoldin subunit 5
MEIGNLMQYVIYTRGMNKDYIWSKPHDDSANHDFLSSNGIVVKRQPDGDYTVYLTSEPTTKKDYIGRNITISCLISNCSDWVAKGLTIYTLQHWNHFVQDFERFVDNFGSDDWSVDEDAVKRFVSKHLANATGKTWATKIENDNTDETRNNLLEDLLQYAFSANAGIKCVIDNGVLTGNDCLTKIRTEADVYLWTGGSKKILTSNIPPDNTEKNFANTEITKINSKPRSLTLTNLFPNETVLQLLVLVLLAASILCNIYLIKTRNDAQKNYKNKIKSLNDQFQASNETASRWKKQAEILKAERLQAKSTNIPIRVSQNPDNSYIEVMNACKNLQKQIDSMQTEIKTLTTEVKKITSEPVSKLPLEPEKNNNPEKKE